MNELPRQPHRSRCQGTLISALHLTHVQERIGLLSDPLVYPCEYVSKRRRPTTHELLAVSAVLTINVLSIADHPSYAHPSLVGLRHGYAKVERAGVADPRALSIGAGSGGFASPHPTVGRS